TGSGDPLTAGRAPVGRSIDPVSPARRSGGPTEPMLASRSLPIRGQCPTADARAPRVTVSGGGFTLGGRSVRSTCRPAEKRGAMARITVLDPTATPPELTPEPGPDAGTLT